MSDPKLAHAGTGWVTRLGISLQVVVTGVLALGVVLLVNWLAGRPGLHLRFDLTEKRLNTLSTAALGMLGRLEEPVQIDVFFRPEPGPLAAVADEAMQRTYRLLVLFDQAGEHIDVTVHDMNDTLEVQVRLDELQVRGFENCIVVSSDGQREVLRLVGELAQFDPGRPRQAGFRPATILSYDAEQRLVQGILGVTSGDVVKVYFSTGHGERDLYDLEEVNNLGKLHTALIEDGFDAAWWQFEEDGPVPEDCSALALIGPTTPFAEQELLAIQEYVDAGGRLIVATANRPDDLERSSIPELLEYYGVEVSPGLVAQPFVDSTGQVVFGDTRSAAFRVLSDSMLPHPITDPLRQGDRNIVFSFTHSLKVVRQPEGGGVRPILRSQPVTWLDLPPNDFQPDPDGEIEGPFDVALVAEIAPPGTQDVAPLEARTQSRIVIVGSSDVFCSKWIEFNADFLRNVFNWAVSRDYRVNISPRDPDLRRLPMGESNETANVARFALWVVPGVCFLLGVAMAFVRRSRGPSLKSS
jgi:hypothetical protein